MERASRRYPVNVLARHCVFVEEHVKMVRERFLALADVVGGPATSAADDLNDEAAIDVEAKGLWNWHGLSVESSSMVCQRISVAPHAHCG